LQGKLASKVLKISQQTVNWLSFHFSA